MAIPNLDAAVRVTRKLLDRYGAARLMQVEELRPGIYRGRLNDGTRPWRWYMPAAESR